MKTPLKIVTWNINSVRLRLPLLQKLIASHNPDIIALQECKCPEEHFPHDDVKALGFPHSHYWGMKGYNGTAILSKIPFEVAQKFNRCGKDDCRHVSVQFPEFDLHNLYIPAGGYEPDPICNPSFQHKLDFIDEMTDWFPAHYKADKPMILVGDLNVAPLEHDVWSHKQMLKVVSHTPMEVERFTKMQHNFGWVDAMRHFIPAEEKLYTWWSYRAKDWAASNRGRRLDHVWVTPPLVGSLKSLTVLKEAQGWERPSDHVPTILTLAV